VLRADNKHDHILPVAHGGATTLQNLQLLCAECNRGKSDSI
jgi:5-methylcytosine-specific restriction endonuclease McrA